MEIGDVHSRSLLSHHSSLNFTINHFVKKIIYHIRCSFLNFCSLAHQDIQQIFIRPMTCIFRYNKISLTITQSVSFKRTMRQPWNLNQLLKTNKQTNKQTNKPAAVTLVKRRFLLLRRRYLDEIGIFKPSFVQVYLCTVDTCWRARERMLESERAYVG